MLASSLHTKLANTSQEDPYTFTLVLMPKIIGIVLGCN